MKSYIIMAAVILLPILTSACNTVAGAGEDVSKGGQAVERSADNNKLY
jgi:entericidin B